MSDGIRHLLEYATEQRTIGREATSAVLHSIAEVIDCEMRSLKDERDHWMELAHQWEAGASTRGFAERLEAAASERADVTLFGVDYTALPVDADGVPIHVGDVMEWPDCSTAEVVGIGNDTFFFVEDGDDAADWSRASDKIHHHAPTVEDVLREFADRVCNSGHQWGLDAADTIAEYAARLRLAGEDE